MRNFFIFCYIDRIVGKNYCICGVIIYINESQKYEFKEDIFLEGMWKSLQYILRNVFGECYIIGYFFQYYGGVDCT